MWDSRNRKVPRHQRGDDAQGLLDGEDAAAGDRGREGGPLDPLGLAGEPARERGRVLDLAVGLGERLARLVHEDRREVVPVLPDQGVELGQQVGARPRREGAEVLEGGVRGSHGAVDVLGRHVRTRGELLVGARVCGADVSEHSARIAGKVPGGNLANISKTRRTDNVESLPRLGFDPLPIDVCFIPEELRVL